MIFQCLGIIDGTTCEMKYLASIVGLIVYAGLMLVTIRELDAEMRRKIEHDQDKRKAKKFCILDPDNSLQNDVESISISG